MAMYRGGSRAAAAGAVLAALILSFARSGEAGTQAPDAAPDALYTSGTVSFPARVVIHSETATFADAVALADALGSWPAVRVELRRVSASVRRHQVRFFSPADHALARRITMAMRQLDVAGRLRDFTHYRPRPHLGLVEIWIGPRPPDPGD